jgi:hypothetical protein
MDSILSKTRVEVDQIVEDLIKKKKKNTLFDELLCFKLKVSKISGLFDCLISESTTPNSVKAPSDKLFAFNKLAINFIFDTIQPDAKFLFAQLKRYQVENYCSNLSSNSLMRMINEFKSVKTSTEINGFKKEDLLCYELAAATCENDQITGLRICNKDCCFVD